MRRRALLGLLALVLASTGCANLLGRMKRAMRSPGEQLVALPASVSKEYHCDEKHLPYLKVEKNEIAPNLVEAGSAFNHRIVYAMCPRHVTEVVPGTLDTRIRYKGQVIVDDKVKDYEIKPGRWIVDSLVHLPESAETGVYALEVEFRSPTLRMDEKATFGVEGKR
jgi:hypothetical protein